MAWPDYPPPAQIASYEDGLSGTRYWVPDRDGSGTIRVPMEWAEQASGDGTGPWTLKVGYYYQDEFDAWLAGSGDDGGGDDGGSPGGSDEAARVAAFLGAADDQGLIDLAEQHVAIVTEFVRAYTRGEGFTADMPNDELAAVITSATARMVANPEQIAYDSGSTSMRGGFNGFSLAETFVLNRYRKRAI